MTVDFYGDTLIKVSIEHWHCLSLPLLHQIYLYLLACSIWIYNINAYHKHLRPGWNKLINFSNINTFHHLLKQIGQWSLPLGEKRLHVTLFKNYDPVWDNYIKWSFLSTIWIVCSSERAFLINKNIFNLFSESKPTLLWTFYIFLCVITLELVKWWLETTKYDLICIKTILPDKSIFKSLN